MGVEVALYNLLIGDTGVSALIGTSPPRMFPQRAPQAHDPSSASDAGIMPRIVYRRIGTPRRVFAQGGYVGLARARFQLEAWGSTYKQARTLMDAILAASNGLGQPLDGWRQAQMGGASGAFVQKCILENDRDLLGSDDQYDDGDPQAVLVDAVLDYNETVPGQ